MVVYIKGVKITFEVICGLVIGFEIVREYECAMVELGIFRFLIDWSGEEYL